MASTALSWCVVDAIMCCRCINPLMASYKLCCRCDYAPPHTWRAPWIELEDKEKRTIGSTEVEDSSNRIHVLFHLVCYSRALGIKYLLFVYNTLQSQEMNCNRCLVEIADFGCKANTTQPLAWLAWVIHFWHTWLLMWLVDGRNATIWSTQTDYLFVLWLFRNTLIDKLDWSKWGSHKEWGFQKECETN